MCVSSTIRSTSAVPPSCVRQRPCLRLVEIHQRRLHRRVAIHAQRQRRLHRIHRRAPTIRIAGEIRLAHSADQRVQPTPIRHRARKRQEHQIAPRHERRSAARSPQTRSPAPASAPYPTPRPARRDPAGDPRPASPPMPETAPAASPGTPSGSPAPPDAAAGNRTRSSPPAHTGQAPTPGKRQNPARRKTARVRKWWSCAAMSRRSRYAASRRRSGSSG